MPITKWFSGNAVKSIMKYKYVIVVIILGLIFMAFPTSKDKAKPEEIKNDFSLSEFEKKVETALGMCEGVGRVRVIVTLKSGAENVYASEEKSSAREQSSDGSQDINRDSDKKPSIMSDGSGRETPVVIKQVYPKFQGAAVICDGAASGGVCVRIIETVSALTGLTADKISVIKMKK